MKRLNRQQLSGVCGGQLMPINYSVITDSGPSPVAPESVSKPPVTLPVPIDGYAGVRGVHTRVHSVDDNF